MTRRTRPASSIVSHLQRARRHPGISAKRILFAVESAFGHRANTRFIVLGHARTGSNMLLSMLNSHPHVYARGEVFARIDDAAIDDTVTRTFHRRVPRRIQAVGCKVFYYHPRPASSGQLWERLRVEPGLRVVHLRRRNVLRTVISREIANQRGEWLATGAAARPSPSEPLVVSPHWLQTEVERIREFEQGTLDRLSGLPVLDVEYEDLDAAPSASFRHITDFLDLQFVAPVTSTVRQNPEPLSVLLANFEDVRNHFRDSELAPFLDE